MSRLLSCEYVVVESGYMEGFVRMVNRNIELGWECQGSISVSSGYSLGSDKYFQAMVKKIYISDGSDE